MLLPLAFLPPIINGFAINEPINNNETIMNNETKKHNGSGGGNGRNAGQQHSRTDNLASSNFAMDGSQVPRSALGGVQMMGSSEQSAPMDLDTRDHSRPRKQQRLQQGSSGKMPGASMAVAGGVDKTNPAHMAAAEPQLVANSRDSVNSSNSGGSVVKFAMPAVVAYAEPGNSGWPSANRGPSIKVSRIGPQSSSGNGVGIQTVGQGMNNFSGASSGSLSSEGNNATGSSLSLSSGGSRETDGKKKAPSGMKRPESSPQGSDKQSSFAHSSGTSNMTDSGGDDKAPPTSNTNLKNNSSNSRTSTSNSGSGSGSDNNGGATSSSGNAAVVTASTANNNTTSSGSGDDRSSSGSGGGSGSGSGGNRRSAGEASSEFYYAGYGSGPSIGGTSSNQAASVGALQAQGVAAPQAMGMNNNNMPSFAQFQGAPLAASAAAAAAGPNAQAQQPGMGPQNNASNNMGARHVVVATDEGGLPPPPHAFASHLRHHSRHYHNHRNRRSDAAQGPGVDAAGVNAEGANQNNGALPQAPLANAAAAASRPMSGIPSAIGGPTASAARLPSSQQVQRYRGSSAVSNHYELRLPPSDEQAVLQRVPRTHATVVAHDLPPPPTSSDAWSSASGGSSSRSRKRTAANANSGNAMAPGQPMVASVRLSHGGTVDSVNMNDGSPSSSDGASLGEQNVGAGAMHVTTLDPILRKKISLKHEQVQQKPSLDSKPSPGEVKVGPTTATATKPVKAGAGTAGAKRKMSAMKRANTSDDSSDGAKSETEAVGSGSDEGYAASSERQSGSGSDSISSDDAKKEKVASSARGGAGGAAGQSKNKVGGVTMASQSNSKRTETSSMSSSVLADFSSVMNEEGSIALNTLSRSDSPRSSCTSLSSDGNGADAAKAEAAKATQDAAAGGKRDGNHLNTSANARKRSKSEADAKPAANSETMKNGLSIMEKSLQQKVRSAHHHHYHSRSTGRKMLEKSFLSAKRDLSAAEDAASVTSSAIARQGIVHEGKSTGDQMKQDEVFETASIYSLGQDVMAQVVAFLEPPEIHSFLTQPLSKTWLVTYTAPQELWKILCTSKPFYAKLDDTSCGSSDASTCSFPICNDLEMRHLFGRYRLLYTSFVRCMKYLNRLQDDALNGRTPSVYANSNQNDIYPYNKNTSLKAYFAKARRLVRSSRRNGGSRSSSDAALSITSESGSQGSGHDKQRRSVANAGTVALSNSQQNTSSSRRLGRSMLTDRLLRPTQAGDVDNVNLPWSCAIYSVVNWMVAFADVEGIQIMCLKCLPYLLEDESQRTTAQRAGLTDSVLRAMVLFPDSIELHTVAFHTLVLLARPLGGNEGMLFHTAMVNTRGIFNNGSSNSKNGIVIMLDSMRRFAQDEILQAMSCWSLVNVALTPLQKSMLVKLGGLTVTSNAMLQHPYNAEVQFRALFALINLVIPTETRPDETEEMREFEREIFQQLGEVGETSEKEMLDASVGQISNLVVVAMKNFCSSEAILNRACLVLHNLSLNEEYHSILLWTPNCYQMLEWCLGNYPHDHVLQQSAGGTIQRLNATLSADEELRARFTHSIRAQQQHSLELARQEAMLLQEQQREQEQQEMDLS